MSMLKITSLALSIALASGIAIAPTYASSNSKTEASTYETAHLKRKKRSHRHCHTSFINQRLVKTCHKHRHWILHHIRKG